MANDNNDLAKSIGDELRRGDLDSNELEVVDASKITRFYRVPSARFKTADQIVRYYGYRLGDKLAEGGFGKIYYATHVKTAVMVACKQMDLNKSKSSISTRSSAMKPDDSKVTDMKNELYILKKMANPYIVKLYCHFVVNNQLYIFIKLANGGNFHKFVKDKGVLTEHESCIFFAQILVAVEYMHTLSIAHRDVKLDNVLLIRHPNNKYTILLTDFGLSRVISPDGDGPTFSRTCCGTPGFMAPEVLEQKPYDAFQADVFACGVSLFYMLNAELPFKQEESKLVLEAERKREWQWTDNMAEEPTTDLVSMMHSMLEPDPKVRSRMSSLVNHAWVASEVKYSKSFFDSRSKDKSSRGKGAKKAKK